jgi:hypothetical protein
MPRLEQLGAGHDILSIHLFSAVSSARVPAASNHFSEVAARLVPAIGVLLATACPGDTESPLRRDARDDGVSAAQRRGDNGEEGIQSQRTML